MPNRAAVNGVRALAMKLRARDDIGADEEDVLLDVVTEVREVGAGRVIVRHGTKVEISTLLIKGMAVRFKDLANGERQIQEIHIPGDFVDLHGFLLKRLDHNIGAISDCHIALVPHANLKQITEDQPHLSRMLWFSTMLDAAIQRETILSVGRRSAVSRIAHLVCELGLRLQIVGIGDVRRFPLPMKQADLADATGLTSVHVNRMLKQLRDEAMMTFQKGEVVIHDWEKLARVAEFDPSYLHLERMPR
jgi:CRP-like cAMP-binding protein